MKKTISFTGLIAVSLLIVIGCSKNDNVKDEIIFPAKLVKTEYGGCFSKGLEQGSKSYGDTINYVLSNDTLKLHLRIVRNCAETPVDSVVINQSDVIIYIKDNVTPNAYCECGFVFDYYFTDFDTVQNLYVYYKDYNKLNQSDYVLWDSLSYP